MATWWIQGLGAAGGACTRLGAGLSTEHHGTALADSGGGCPTLPGQRDVGRPQGRAGRRPGGPSLQGWGNGGGRYASHSWMGCVLAPGCRTTEGSWRDFPPYLAAHDLKGSLSICSPAHPPTWPAHYRTLLPLAAIYPHILVSEWLGHSADPLLPPLPAACAELARMCDDMSERLFDQEFEAP